MLLLKQLDGDENIEASLLGPTNHRPIPPSTMKEDAVLLGDEPEPQEVTESTTSLLQHPKTPELELQEVLEATMSLPE